MRQPQLFGTDMLEDPYPRYRALRAEGPIDWDHDLQAWIVLGHERVTAVLKDPRFSADKPSIARANFPEPELQPLFDLISLNMANRDEPGHRRIRKLVSHAFQRTAVERYEVDIRRRVDSLIDAGLARGRMDFVTDFAVPLPVMVIGDIVGIPEADRAKLKSWCDDYSFVVNNLFASITKERLLQGLDSTLTFREYLRTQVERLRRAPEESLLSHLVTTEDAGDRLSLDELLMNSLLLLNAGNETTTSLLSNGLLALLHHRDEMARLRDDPSLVASAVEEFLRYDPPVQFLGRIATEDLELQGKKIAKGDLVIAVIAAADRDPERFQEPDRLDISRSDNPHLAFGLYPTAGAA
ncbi:cytochrome P450 [Mycobacterium spongiae]|uniref:Cytochrome P450 n=1 Tax=Mycobacterium spongiae TaxID=886343 RepID=A0A975JXG6_9MYCO|nr:cytochrome P450 [Mycobacterium spongiae]QUR67486.1 cytochrome P450 [Mycobacterium spongiae]